MPAPSTRSGIFQRTQASIYWGDRKEVEAIKAAAKRSGESFAKYVAKAATEKAQRDNARAEKNSGAAA